MTKYSSLLSRFAFASRLPQISTRKYSSVADFTAFGQESQIDPKRVLIISSTPNPLGIAVLANQFKKFSPEIFPNTTFIGGRFPDMFSGLKPRDIASAASDISVTNLSPYDLDLSCGIFQGGKHGAIDKLYSLVEYSHLRALLSKHDAQLYEGIDGLIEPLNRKDRKPKEAIKKLAEYVVKLSESGVKPEMISQEMAKFVRDENLQEYQKYMARNSEAVEGYVLNVSIQDGDKKNLVIFTSPYLTKLVTKSVKEVFAQPEILSVLCAAEFEDELESAQQKLELKEGELAQEQGLSLERVINTKREKSGTTLEKPATEIKFCSVVGRKEDIALSCPEFLSNKIEKFLSGRERSLPPTSPSSPNGGNRLVGEEMGLPRP